MARPSNYTYNDRNELVGANTFAGTNPQSPGAEMIARRRGYDYDPIGNRKASTVWGGDPVTPTVTTYTTNNVNQYTQTTNPAETFTHDLDGNLTSDADNNYYWDNENRLWFVIPKIGGEGKVKLEFNYDHQNRRKRKRVYPWDPSANGGAGDWAATPSQDIRFVYDEWNLVMELDGTNNNAVLRKYTWGLDLSGTMQGAGGIGGLLGIHDEAASKDYLVFSDANGNVGQLIDMSDGSLAARYEYDPYGNALLDPAAANVSGPYADDNPFRFSTKYQDGETGWYYYGYRYLDTVKGRWTSRDPSQEQNGINLFEYLSNDPENHNDALGLVSVSLDFYAFINSRLGSWFPEPFPFSPWEFRGDLRDFGGGSARLYSLITIDSMRIGYLTFQNTTVITNSDPSHRRRPGAYEIAQAVPQWQGLIRDTGPCSSEIIIEAKSRYPFSVLSPYIDYFLIWTIQVKRPGELEISVRGYHDSFPDYEALVLANRDLYFAYTFFTPHSGPTIGNLTRYRPFSGTTIRVPADTPSWCCRR